MYHDNVPLDVLPDRMHAFLVGGGEKSFIGRTVWEPTLRVIPDIAFTYACPSRNEEAAERYRRVRAMDKGNVSNDFSSLLATAMGEGDPSELMVCIATETSTHVDLIIRALEAGVLNIVCDKPIAPRLEQALRIEDALRKAPNAQVYVIFNHRYNAAVALLKQIVAQALAEGKQVSVDGAFHQNWLCEDTKSKQAKSRITDHFCTLLDLGVHVSDLITHIVGRPILGVHKATVSRDLADWATTITGGNCALLFGDNLNVQSTLSVNQCMKGEFLDDIWIQVTIPEDNVRYLWRMRECGGDNLLVGKAAGRMTCRADWKLLERGASNFDAKIATTFGMHPPGHSSCSWGMMWRYLFCSILGDIWRRQDLPIIKEPGLEACFRLPVPTLACAGIPSLAYVEAHVLSAHKGEHVSLSYRDLVV